MVTNACVKELRVRSSVPPKKRGGTKAFVFSQEPQREGNHV